MWLDTLGKLIYRMERTHLDEGIAEEFDPLDLFSEEEQVFFSVEGLTDFWHTHGGIDFAQHITDMVMGVHNQQQSDITLVLAGTLDKVHVFISLGDETTTRTLTEGILPGIRLSPTPVADLGRFLSPHFHAKGLLTGIPSRKSFTSSPQEPSSPQEQERDERGVEGLSQLERVVRGMRGATWAYVVQAHPRPRYKVAEERLRSIDALAQVTSESRIQWQSTQQDHRQVTVVQSDSQTQTLSGDAVNYRAHYLIKLLESELERLNKALAVGQWIVRTYFGASTGADARRLASLLLGTLAGKQSRPDPLRATFCRAESMPLSTFDTFLTSDEVATLIQFPREEAPGYALHDFVRFDVDFRPAKGMDLSLGHIQQNGRDTYTDYKISLDALTKHAVVVGVTGSGKTTSIMGLLDRVVEAKRPFLVIEPAKTEYRALRTSLQKRADVHIYTLGSETTAPFRLNPFEFETGDLPESTSLLTHIDFLKAVFNAAFVLYSPMPHVLETALHEVYEDKGWDLATSTNTRLSAWQKRHSYPIFPTLTDLYYKVETVTNRLGYDGEVERNVKAGLKARIGSLRIGSKGVMLDTVRSIPMKRLLAYPTVLEMESVGNDDEKTFLIGLFLARLYEYRRLQAASGTLPDGLQHLLVVEEAHRLLKNTATQVDVESSNMRAQAIEVFTNMLSEVRAYGQGILVAEQIPSKLAPDVLKNTNMKIVHRLIAQDDRQSVGQTMNLSADQMTHLGILAPGMAAVYAEGADHAYLVRLDNYKRLLSPLQDEKLRHISPRYASVKHYQAITNMEAYGIPLSSFGGPDAVTFQNAGKLLDTQKSRWLWANVLLRTLNSPMQLRETIDRFSELVEEEMAHLAPAQHDHVVQMLLIRGCAEQLQERGARFGWSYEEVEQMRHPLTLALLALVRTHELGAAQEHLAHFTSLYREYLTRRQGPFAGCIHCKTRCHYRFDVRTLLADKDRAWINEELTQGKYETLSARYSGVAKIAQVIAERWLGEPKRATLDLAYCCTLHTVAQSGYTEYEQQLFTEMIKPYLLE